MNREQTVQLLSQYGIQPDPDLDRQHLVDPAALQSLTELVDPKPQESVLEVEPGVGNITEGLLAAGTVTVIEKNRSYVKVLRDRFAGEPSLTVVRGSPLREPLTGYDKIVGNLHSRICEPFFSQLPWAGFKLGVFIVPSGFMEILDASTSDMHYNKLSYVTGLFFTITRRFTVPASAYYPEPGEPTHVVTLEPREPTGTAETVMVEVWKQSDKRLKNALRESLIRAGVTETKRQSREHVAALKVPENQLKLRVAGLTLDELLALHARLETL